jgi:hypothetical protein
MARAGGVLVALRGGARAALARLDDVDAARAALEAHAARRAEAEAEAVGALGRGLELAEEACAAVERAVGRIRGRLAQGQVSLLPPFALKAPCALCRPVACLLFSLLCPRGVLAEQRHRARASLCRTHAHR